MTRLLLISGKGGVGKTTISAATAIASADAGHRTLVASLDRAHNLAGVLALPTGASSPVAVPGVERLWVVEIDAQAELRAQWGEVEGWLSAWFAWMGLPAAVADEVAILPGLEEILVLGRLVDLLESEAYDVVIADLAPTASSLRYLSFPDLAAGALRRLLAMDRMFLSLARPVLSRTTAMPLPADGVYAGIERVLDRLGRLRDVLVDPERTTVRLVAIPEAVVIDETREAFGAMSLFGLTVDAIALNRVLPPEATTGYLAAWAAVQARERARVEQGFANLARLEVLFQPDEPLGVAALRRVGAALYRGGDPATPLVEGRPVQFESVGGRTVLAVALGEVVAGELDLLERDGELVLTVGRWRRAIRLPDSLRRTPVERAWFEGGRLRVAFAASEER